ncbi:MAG: DJ-1/PfpI family protein [Lachnospiraceae bacterium]|nr:DJ-1/PfpI family protein [Lachnospiraceae bacterium]
MNVNIILFDEFETLDAFGPAQIFGRVPEHFHINYLSENGGIISSSQGAGIWTEELWPEEISDVLIIPGGRGAKRLLYLEKELLEHIKKSAEMADYCLMVENGSAILAQTGLLYRRKIADYSYDENWKRMFTAGIVRIPDIRWMADGKYYSCSDSFSSIDMSLGVVAELLDIDVAAKIASQLGYGWDCEEHDGILL